MGNKQTILVVDDIPDNLDVAAEILLRNDLSVIVAQSGKSALLSVNKHLPDLILLDVMMPDMDGYEVCAQLKSSELTKEIPIIFLSAITEIKNIVKGFKVGAVDYITKPFIPEELISRVKNHLKIYQQKKEIYDKEKLLEESEAKLLAVINSIPDLIFYKDTESKYTGFNNAFATYLGEKPENIIGYTDFDFYNKIDAQNFREADKIIIHANKNVVFKEWTQDFDGNKIFLDTKKTALKNSDGKIIGIVGVSRNLTELKIAEQSLKEKEEKLSNIYDNANEGIFILQNNKVVFFNKKILELTGYNKAEFDKRYFHEFIYIDDQKKAADYYQKKINGEKIGKAIILRLVDATNNIIYVKINSKQIEWEGRYGVLGMVDDITEQYLLEQELKESRDRLKQSQKAGRIGAWEWNFETDKIRWSDIAYEIFGNKKISSYVNVNEFLSYVHPDDKERILKEFNTVIENKKVSHKTEYRIIKSNKKISWIEETSEIIYCKDGKPDRMIGVLQDITDRKLAEKELEQKNIEIEKNRDEIISSIDYAKTIQASLFLEQNEINKLLKNNFIFYIPKDIVSGDFYYVNKINNDIFFTVGDCTGHGVPGGFITMLGINSLHGILKEGKTKPNEILNCLRTRIKDVFKGVDNINNNNNGIDIAFCTIDIKTNILQYSGAFNPLWVVRNDELIEIKATRNPIGFYPAEKEFANNEFQLQNNDKLYIFSDGFKDQIGGPDLKKFNNRRFKELIVESSKYSMEQQSLFLTKTLDKWKANNEQIDDITIMGVEWEM